MRKKKIDQLLAEIEDLKVYQQSVDRKIARYTDQLERINSKLDLIGEKFDLIIQWSKFNGQMWDKN